MPKEAGLRFTAASPKTVALKPTVVCWLDVLGLRERLAAAASIREEPAFVAEYLRVLRPIYKSLRWKFSKDTGFRWNAFTDTIVLSASTTVGHPEPIVGSIAMAASEIQFRLACQGWFLRGGFAFGRLWSSNEFVIGSGLMSAYKLETEEAVWPRVILDTATRNVLPEFLEYYAAPKDSPQNQEFARDEDGQVFLNYLFVPIEQGFEGAQLRELFATHRERVMKELDTHAAPSRLRAKYLWVAAYHNWFCLNWLDQALAVSLRIKNVPVRGFSCLADG